MSNLRPVCHRPDAPGAYITRELPVNAVPLMHIEQIPSRDLPPEGRTTTGQGLTGPR